MRRCVDSKWDKLDFSESDGAERQSQAESGEEVADSSDPGAKRVGLGAATGNTADGSERPSKAEGSGEGGEQAKVINAYFPKPVCVHTITLLSHVAMCACDCRGPTSSRLR